MAVPSGSTKFGAMCDRLLRMKDDVIKDLTCDCVHSTECRHKVGSIMNKFYEKFVDNLRNNFDGKIDLGGLVQSAQNDAIETSKPPMSSQNGLALPSSSSCGDSSQNKKSGLLSHSTNCATSSASQASHSRPKVQKIGNDDDHSQPKDSQSKCHPESQHKTQRKAKPKRQMVLPKLKPCSYPNCKREFYYKKDKLSHQMVHEGMKPLFRCTWPACKFTTDTSFSRVQQHLWQAHLSVPISLAEKKRLENCGVKFSRNPQFDDLIEISSVKLEKESLPKSTNAQTTNIPEVVSSSGADDISLNREDKNTLSTSNENINHLLLCPPTCTSAATSSSLKPKGNSKSQQKLARKAVRSSAPKSKCLLCPYPKCGELFSQKESLLNHKLKHLGFKPFHCKWSSCQFASTRLDLVRSHIRNVHLRVPVSVIKQMRLGMAIDHNKKVDEFIEVNQIELDEAKKMQKGQILQGLANTLPTKVPQIALCADGDLSQNQESEELTQKKQSKICASSSQSQTTRRSKRKSKHLPESQPKRLTLPSPKPSDVADNLIGNQGSICVASSKRNVRQSKRQSKPLYKSQAKVTPKRLQRKSSRSPKQKAKLFTCPYPKCGRLFPNGPALLTHKLNHRGIKPFHCKWPSCKHVSSSISNIRRHVKMMHLRVPSEGVKRMVIDDNQNVNDFIEVNQAELEEGEKVQEESSLLKSPLRREGKRFLCPYSTCDRSFNNFTKFQTHKLIHRGFKPFHCKWSSSCQFASTRFDLVRGHIRKVHLKVPISVAEQKRQGMVIDGNQNVNDFIEVNQAELEEGVKVQEESSLLKAPLRREGKRFLCPYSTCDRSFVDRTQFQTHKLSHRGFKPFHCKWTSSCQFVSNRLDCVRIHIRKAHLQVPISVAEQKRQGMVIDHNHKVDDFIEVNQKELEEGEKVLEESPLVGSRSRREKKQFICPYSTCDRSFIDRTKFQTHKLIHRGFKPFNCKWSSSCQFVSNRLDYVRIHIRKVHLQVPKVTEQKRQGMVIDHNHKVNDFIEVNQAQLDEVEKMQPESPLQGSPSNDSAIDLSSSSKGKSSSNGPIRPKPSKGQDKGQHKAQSKTQTKHGPNVRRSKQLLCPYPKCGKSFSQSSLLQAHTEKHET